MARYTGPSCRRCRREQEKLFLKGERCYKDSCAMNRRPFPPGQHGQRRSKMTDFAVQFREKQKLRNIYGVSEKQFRGYYEKASNRKGDTGLQLLNYLESRMDCVVFRMGFASSIKEARQVINHGHLTVNGRRMDIPSYQVNKNDVLAVKDGYKENVQLELAQRVADRRTAPAWLEIDKKTKSGVYTRAIESKQEIGVEVEENLIIEFYSK